MLTLKKSVWVQTSWFHGLAKLAKTYTEITIQTKKDWNGFQISTNWFKPFYFFENGSFISYQGCIDYQFGMDKDNKALNTSNGGAMFNGIYWHSDRFAVG